MEIKVYAPVDCEAKPLSECSDDAFKNGFLGNGFLIIPNSETFVSPFEKATVKMIFETKHAYGLNVEGFDALIHCGLETVQLKGEPFTTPLNLEQDIKKGDKLFTVNLKMIKEKNLSIETPIVFDQTELDLFDLKGFKAGSYKQGELICTIEIKKKEVPVTKTKEELMEEIATGHFQLTDFKSKYVVAAEEFIDAVGPKNFKKVYNCMTRVRFQVIDKNTVNQDKIKKNKLVKGINWAGTELQVIIGGECYKVREEIEKIMKEGPKKAANDNTVALVKTKKTFNQKFMSVIGGVMIPAIPVLMAFGLIGAIFGILNASHVLEVPSGTDAATSKWYEIMLYAMYDTALIGIGIFFCYNTVKFMGGNPIMGIMLGMILCSRLLLGTGTEIGIFSIAGAKIPVSPTNAEYASLHFGEYINVQFYQLKGFYLFHMGDYPVLIKSYESSILPFIGAAVLYCYIDRWIKRWMPTTIDICFRPPLAVIATIICTFFLVAPVTSLVEFAFLRFFQMADNLPFGLGSALFATLWEPLVITGTHVAVGLAVALPVYLGHSSALWASTGATGSGQCGAAIAVALKTKNKNLRNVAWSSFVAAYFGGVSEPMIYGVNLPKVTPFIGGLIGSFVGGWVYGFLKVDIDFLGPAIFPLNLVSFTGHLEWLKVVIATLISYAVGIGVTWLIYRERADEYRLTKRTLKKMARLAKVKANAEELKKIQAMQEAYVKRIKTNKADFIKYEKYIQKAIDIENKLASLQDKEEKTRKKLYDFAQKTLLNEKVSNEKKAAAVKTFNDYSLQDKIHEYEVKKAEWTAQHKDLVTEFNALIADLEKDMLAISNAYYMAAPLGAVKAKETGLWNAIHTVQIGYGYEDAKVQGVSKEDKKVYKEALQNYKVKMKNEKMRVKA